MSFTYTVNQTPTNGAAAALLLINAMLSAGWALPQWSDGSTVHSSGTPTASNLAVTYSWVRLQTPADYTTGAIRELCIQFSGSNGDYTSSNGWAVKYSARAGFTTASPTPATNMPTASDEVLFGAQSTSGSPALGNNSSGTGWTGSASYATLGTGAAYRFHCAVGNSGTPDAGSFYYLTSANTTTTTQYCMAFDVAIPWAGTSDLDTATCLIQISTANCFLISLINSNSYSHTGRILGATTTVSSLSYESAVLSAPQSRALPVNSWSGDVPLITPIWVANYSVSTTTGRGVGTKGYSRLYTTDLGSAARTNYDLFTVSATGDHIWINGTLLPWPSGTSVTL